MSRERATALIAAAAGRMQDAVRLAELASLAVRIEPHLLRRLRIDYLPNADVGVEADLWFSHLVDSRGTDAVVLEKDVAHVLRERLSVHPRLADVVAALEEAHRDEPPTIVLEEKLNAIAVQRGASAVEAIDIELRAAIIGIREGDDRARDVARWFLRAWPRLHPVVRRSANAIALALGASLLLGRRGGAAVPETDASLRDLGWVLSGDALEQRVDVGVERLGDALRFVSLAATPAGASGPTGSVGTMSVPRAEPRLVEVGWSSGGRDHRRVVEASPGRTVAIGADAAGIRFVTLAGDEYEVEAAAGGTTSAREGIEVDITREPYRDIAAACVMVRASFSPPAYGTALRVTPQMAITVGEPFAYMGQAYLVLDDGERLTSVSADTQSWLIRLFPPPGDTVGRLPTPPFHTEEREGGLERRPERAVVIGYDGKVLRGVEGQAQIDDLRAAEFTVTVASDLSWLAGWRGALVVIDGITRGLVAKMSVPSPGVTSLQAIGAERLQRFIESSSGKTTSPTPVPPEPDQPNADEPKNLPSWVPLVTVTVRAALDNVAATGLVVSDRVIVSSATALRGAGAVVVSWPDGQADARVLDLGGEGPLVWIGVLGTYRFSTVAPLLSASRQTRRPDDPPYPTTAMLVAARDGLRAKTIPDALDAGLVRLRDPDGHTVRLDINNVKWSSEFNDGIVVWGDHVAGVILRDIRPPRRPNLELMRRQIVEVLSVNAIRDGIDRANEAIDALAQPRRLQAFISSTFGELDEHQQYLIERLRAHGIESLRREAYGLSPSGWRGESAPAIEDSDLVIFLVGEKAGGGPEGESRSWLQFEYDIARREGADIMVLLSGYDDRVTDPAFKQWRDELQKEHAVIRFDDDPRSIHIDEALREWLARRQNSEQDDGGSTERNAPVPNEAAIVEDEAEMRRALEVEESKHGPGHPEVAIRLNALAQVLVHRGRLEEAESLIRRALAIDETHYGADHLQTAKDLATLAWFFQTTGRVADAEEPIRRALRIEEASANHHNVATHLTNLARVLEAMGRLAEAEPLMRRALEINEAASGPDHPNVARALANLAGLLEATGRLAEPEQLMQQALAIDEKHYGNDHPEVARDLNSLAWLFQSTGRVVEAEQLLRRAMEINEATSGPDHPNVARALTNLAGLLETTDRLAEAEQMMWSALAIDEKHYGSDHPVVAQDLSSLARLFHATKRFDEAEPLILRALAIDEAHYGGHHPEVAKDLSTLARLFQATNRLADAEPLMRRALALDEAHYGPDHPNVAMVLTNLAVLLEITGRPTEAEPLMQRARAIEQHQPSEPPKES